MNHQSLQQTSAYVIVVPGESDDVGDTMTDGLFSSKWLIIFDDEHSIRRHEWVSATDFNGAARIAMSWQSPRRLVAVANETQTNKTADVIENSDEAQQLAAHRVQRAWELFKLESDIAGRLGKTVFLRAPIGDDDPDVFLRPRHVKLSIGEEPPTR